MAFAAASVDAASAILGLSKAAWKLASSLSTLEPNSIIVDTTVRNLAREVRSLGNECDLVYAELEDVVGKTETGPPPYDVDGRMWNCLATQVEETGRTLQELELFVANAGEEAYASIGNRHRQRGVDQGRDQIGSVGARICRHTHNLHATLLLINTVFVDLPSYRADRGLANQLEKLQGAVERLQKTSEADPQSRFSHSEASLMECACEVILRGSSMYEPSLVPESIVDDRPAGNTKSRVVEWVSALESIRQSQRLSAIMPLEESNSTTASPTSEQRAVLERNAVNVTGDDGDDDLDTDLAKAALDTGTTAFEAQEWEEADSLLQEALRILHQLPNHRRAFCDIFGLQYKLAVCAYHMLEPVDAEEALMSLVQQSANTDEQRGYVYDAAHLLSHLYLRMGQVDRARSQCEKALQARRRLLGKQSDASLESTALMAHIYFLLNNRARAKSYLAMIPQERKGAILKIVEESLGTKVEQPSGPSQCNLPDMPVNRTQTSTPVTSPPPPAKIENRYSRPVSAMLPPSRPGSLRRLPHRVPSNPPGYDPTSPRKISSTSYEENRRDSRAIEWKAPTERKRSIESRRSLVKTRSTETVSTHAETLGAAATSPTRSEIQEGESETMRSRTLTRKQILENIGCQPKDKIEEAVCDSDQTALAALLGGKKESWRSRIRKRGRPERVTALHFAALFGEIDMAGRLIQANFNINEVPHGYSTILTPLKFAVGARQVEMVEFLTSNGAKPTEPDTWSTLAGQLMNRSWLKKTMSESEKDFVPHQITAILGILLRQGWDVNAPFESSGKTVLQQAVTFWTGSYRWDLNLSAAVTSFLCERGADPFKADKEGKTPHALAMGSGHQDLLQILSRASRQPGREPIELGLTRGATIEPVELPAGL